MIIPRYESHCRILLSRKKPDKKHTHSPALSMARKKNYYHHTYRPNWIFEKEMSMRPWDSCWKAIAAFGVAERP